MPGKGTLTAWWGVPHCQVGSSDLFNRGGNGNWVEGVNNVDEDDDKNLKGNFA